jgi:hypothetical protein
LTLDNKSSTESENKNAMDKVQDKDDGVSSIKKLNHCFKIEQKQKAIVYILKKAKSIGQKGCFLKLSKGGVESLNRHFKGVDVEP